MLAEPFGNAPFTTPPRRLAHLPELLKLNQSFSEPLNRRRATGVGEGGPASQH
jgi:hypothetical protein